MSRRSRARFPRWWFAGGLLAGSIALVAGLARHSENMTLIGILLLFFALLGGFLAAIWVNWRNTPRGPVGYDHSWWASVLGETSTPIARPSWKRPPADDDEDTAR